MRLDVAAEVVRHEVVVAVVDDGVAERTEAPCVAKSATFYGVKDFS